MTFSRIISIAFFALGAICFAALTILPDYPDKFSSIVARSLFALGALTFGWEVWTMLGDSKSSRTP